MAGVPFGTQLLINGNVYTVEDLGTPYGHVDIFFNNHSDALSFGLQSVSRSLSAELIIKIFNKKNSDQTGFFLH